MFQTQEAMQLILYAIVEEIKTNTHTRQVLPGNAIG